MNKTMLFIHLGIPLVWALIPLMLVLTGRLNYQRLKSLRRYAIVANLIIAALVTTPEILTQIVAAAALQACYEATVWITRYRERRQKVRGH
jgi:sec-independent protein translocase protein TatC